MVNFGAKFNKKTRKDKQVKRAVRRNKKEQATGMPAKQHTTTASWKPPTKKKLRQIGKKLKRDLKAAGATLEAIEEVTGSTRPTDIALNIVMGKPTKAKKESGGNKKPVEGEEVDAMED